MCVCVCVCVCVCMYVNISTDESLAYFIFFFNSFWFLKFARVIYSWHKL